MSKAPSRLARTIRSLVAMIALGLGLAVYNSISVSHDISLATGPKSEDQHQFFLNAADRPDIELFYKGLPHDKKVTLAERIGEYGDPKLGDLIGKLLGTFDVEARKVLTTSLVHVGQAHPEAISTQLKRPGSLQQLAVTSALRELGAAALPSVVQQLKVADARTNSVSYLVASGKPAIPYLLPFLDEKDLDVRSAAADALGKLSAQEAVEKLTQLYHSSKGDEQFVYLSAISGVGDPGSEALLTSVVRDDSVASTRRAQAMLGLGRIGTPSAVQTLWSLTGVDDPQSLDAAISALQLAGPQAIASAPSPTLALRVAGGIKDATAEAFIARSLLNPATVELAADASTGRSTLVPSLVASVHTPGLDGQAIDALLRALGSTSEGATELKKLADDPQVGGLAFRRARILGG